MGKFSGVVKTMGKFSGIVKTMGKFSVSENNG